MDIESIFGCHSVFFYYGKAHLMVNLYHYIKSGISNNQFIYLYLEPNIFDEVINRLSKSDREKFEVLTQDTLFKSAKNDHIDIGNIIKHYYDKAMQKGFSGVRFFIQVKGLLEEFGDNLFLIENKITESIKDIKASVVCAYDFEGYINDKMPLRCGIFQYVLKAHTHRLSEFKIEKIERESL